MTSDNPTPDEPLPDWEHELAELLSMLSESQGDLLQLLEEKRKLLVDSDTAGLVAIAAREQKLIERLQQCHQRRADLLARAGDEGLPDDSIQSLASAVPSAKEGGLEEEIKQAKLRSRLVQHHSLTNWVITQRTLIHLSQMLEIIATGGRGQPTYGKEDTSSGSLIDRAA